MKTATAQTKPSVQELDPKFTIRIAMWERVGGGVFPSPTQIDALHKELNQQHPCLLHSKN